MSWADNDNWLKRPTTKDENPRTRNGGDFHINRTFLLTIESGFDSYDSYLSGATA